MSEEAGGGGHGHEMIIVKRHGGAHDEHHGGVWKIAFADFMTAMMAFFLVMWLISANDKTKAVIAKYFNPIELVDSTPQPRGLQDSKKDDPNVDRKSETPGPDSHGKEAKPTESAGAASESAAPQPVDRAPMDDADQTAKHQEMQLIADPYAVIAEIAEKDKKSAEPPKQTAATAMAHDGGGSGAVGLQNGEAFRDPFEPQPVAAGANPLVSPSDRPVASAVSTAPGATGPSIGADRVTTGPGTAPPAGAAPVAEAMAAPQQQQATSVPQQQSTSVPPAPPPTPASVPTPAPTSSGAAPGMPGASTAASSADAAATPGKANAPAPLPAGDANDGKPIPSSALRAKLAALAKTTEQPGAPGAPKIEIRHTDEGTLISLTDTVSFSMFASASARPSPETVAMMARIGALLKTQKGGVTIRGYTDSRPFRSETYDNWRLSTERAHIAQYMLERGGLDDKRIDRIEGYADRHPKNAKDPESAENRRIEILLRDTTP